MEHLSQYMNITEEVTSTGRYQYIIEGTLPPSEKIPKLDRKNKKISLTEEKQEDYADFVIKDLGVEYKPNSKIRESRRAIDAFGGRKYGHSSAEAVRERYVGPAMEKYGERSTRRVWVDTRDYSPLDEEQLVFLEENLSRNCPYTRKELLAMVGQKEEFELAEVRGNFGKVLQLFKEKYGFMPYCAQEWKAKVRANVIEGSKEA